MKLSEFEQRVYLVCILKYDEDFGGRLSISGCLRKIESIIGSANLVDYALAKRALQEGGEEGRRAMKYDPLFNEI